MAPKTIKKMTSKQKRGRSRTAIQGRGRMANVEKAKGGKSGSTRMPAAQRAAAVRAGKRG